MKIKYLLYLSIVLIGVGCSSPLPEIKTIEPQKKESPIYENDLRINTKQIYCWVNNIPGDKPRFNITGEINLFEDSNYNINNITIKKVFIIQNNISVYQLTPKLDTKFNNNIKSILFSTVQGMLLSPQLDASKTIDIKISLSDSAKDIDYFIRKVQIEEVY